MSDDAKKAEESKPERRGMSPLSLILPAVLAGGAAFGGVKLSANMHGQAPPAETVAVAHAEPPGPTIALDPFVATVPDAADKARAMKVTLAIELEHGGKEEEFKAFVPRVRDTTLSYLRSLTYEQVSDNAFTETMRRDLLERMKKTGANGAEAVLITDLVVQ